MAVDLFCAQRGSKPSLDCVLTAILAAGLLRGLSLLVVAYIVAAALYVLSSFAVVLHTWFCPGIGCTLQLVLTLSERRVWWCTCVFGP